MPDLYPKYTGETQRDEHDNSSAPYTKRVLLYGWDTANLSKVKLALTPQGTLALADYSIVTANDGTYDYFAFALPGTSTATASWKVFRIDANLNKQYADGNALFDNTATDLTALSYS